MRQDEPEGRAWAEQWALTIRQNIAAIRGKVSTRELAERCAALGYPIARSTIAGIENGDRKAVSLPELAVLARALGVPPVRLLFDLRVGDVPGEVLPGVEALPVEGLEWFAGRARLAADGSVETLTNGSADGGLSNARTEHECRLRAIFLVDERARLQHELTEAEAGVLPATFPSWERMDHLDVTSGMTDVEFAVEQRTLSMRRLDNELHGVLGALRQARAGLRAAGMTPPALPEVLRSWVDSLGGDA